jgi:hypothetical protein
MSARSTPALPSEVRDRLEQVLERFEDDWRAGRQPVLEEYLDGSGPERQALLIELVHTDLHYWLRRGEAVRVESYLRRHPDLAQDTAAALELIEAEYRLRSRIEPSLTVEEYLRRFPQWRGELAARLPQLTIPSPGPAEPTSIAGRGKHGRAATASPPWKWTGRPVRQLRVARRGGPRRHGRGVAGARP